LHPQAGRQAGHISAMLCHGSYRLAVALARLAVRESASSQQPSAVRQRDGRTMTSDTKGDISTLGGESAAVADTQMSGHKKRQLFHLAVLLTVKRPQWPR